MLAQMHTGAEATVEPILTLNRTKVVLTYYLCPSSTCLTAEISVHAASSFANVWIVSDDEIGRSWLMEAPKPSCPYCGASLVAANHKYTGPTLPLL